MLRKRTSLTSSRPRVAVMISQDEAVSHHVDVYWGIQKHVLETARWQLVLDPFADEQLKGNRHTYDGIIARATPTLYERSRRRGVPVVNVWQNSPVADRFPSVFANGMTAGRMAAEHLMARGLRRFGFLNYQQDRHGNRLLAGFRGRLAEEGLECSELKVAANMSLKRAQWENGCRKMRQWIESWDLPIGVLGISDECLQILANLCQTEYGLSIPHELALVGCGNEPVRCERPDLMLTSIDLNYRLVGRTAAQLLQHIMDGHPPPTEPVWIEPAELVARQSTDVTAVDDPLVASALRFIAEHCHKPIQVTDVAEGVAVSLRSLQERFRRKLGRSISQQIEYLRVERLKRLMMHSDEPVKVLARQCGFVSMNTVHRAFLRLEGIAPSRFRRQRHNAAQHDR